MSLLAPSPVDIRLLVVGVTTGLATLGGGVLALRLKSYLDALAAIGAGVVIGIALVDLLPEALTLGRTAYPPRALLLLTLLGFLFYGLVDHLKGLIGANAFEPTLGTASLVLHSLMDGFGIGLAFGVSAAVGLTVAAAVLAHDLLDGSNTVTLSLSGRPDVRLAWGWLWLDALAPLVGILFSRLFAPPPTVLPLALALFAGLFLFIGAGELLPRSRVGASGTKNAVLTFLGAAFVAALALLGAS